MTCYYTAVSYDGPFTLTHVIRLANQMIRDHVQEGDITLRAEVHIWHNKDKKQVALVAGILEPAEGWEQVL